MNIVRHLTANKMMGEGSFYLCGDIPVKISFRLDSKGLPKMRIDFEGQTTLLKLLMGSHGKIAQNYFEKAQDMFGKWHQFRREIRSGPIDFRFIDYNPWTTMYRPNDPLPMDWNDESVLFDLFWGVVRNSPNTIRYGDINKACNGEWTRFFFSKFDAAFKDRPILVVGKPEGSTMKQWATVSLIPSDWVIGNVLSSTLISSLEYIYYPNGRGPNDPIMIDKGAMDYIYRRLGVRQ